MIHPKMPSTRLLLTWLAAAVATIQAAECDCYVTDGGPSPTYFKDYGFWDFRTLSQYSGSPPLIDTFEGNSQAGFTSDFFSSTSSFQNFWAPQNWNDDEEILRTNSFNNLYITPSSSSASRNATMLRMRTARGSDFQSTAAFQSKDMVDHASMRMLSRTHGSAGACTSIFTYLGAENMLDVQEADIEILTKDPETRIRYTNQPAHYGNGTLVHGAGHRVTLPDGKKWTEWLTHRMDWTPGLTTWFVDGREMRSQSFQAPVDPSRIVLNTWSDGGNWTGTMDQGGQAFQDIQWIEIAYNLAEEGSCARVCSVNGGAAGSPQPV
ncbi:hypothetical protein NLU13_3949 [Sarocladium strictum]|uniref:GH16 domain-containing protein n=1 Tax=Sarocladium strictum TaxID=5046 RepID=A0AA39GIS3_SARSR|nr:hypothetical protein NLU13_3949 [Sarocladium strictum]